MSTRSRLDVPLGSGSLYLRGWFDVETPCQGGNSELWFADTVEGLTQAQQRCQPCPLRAECLAGAVQRREPWGVWGGELFEHGVPVARKRPRGRPRKHEQVPTRVASAALAERLAQTLHVGPCQATAHGDDETAA